MSYETIKIILEGNPIPYAAARKGAGGRWYNPRSKEKKDMEILVLSQYNEPPIETAVTIHYLFIMPIPKSWSKKKREEYARTKPPHVVKPDADNMQKFFNDCIKGIVIKDDNQIALAVPFKRYGDSPRTIMWINKFCPTDIQGLKGSGQNQYLF